VKETGRFPFTKNFGKYLLGISVWEKRVRFATSSIRGSRGRPGRLKDRERYGTGDKNNKDEKSVLKWNTNFHWEVSTGKKENFQWNEPKSRVPFTSQPEFPEFFGKWKTTTVSCGFDRIVRFVSIQ